MGLSLPVCAQSEKQLEISKCVRIEGGYIFGNQIFSSDPLSSPGGLASYTYGFKTSKRIGLGIGCALNLFEKETFIPIYIDMITFLKEKKNTTFFDFKAGYALCWSNNFQNYEVHSYKGGMNLGLGVGRRFKLNERFCFTLTAYYNHQFASVSYSTDTAENITEQLNYDLLTLCVGFMLEQK